MDSSCPWQRRSSTDSQTLVGDLRLLDGPTEQRTRRCRDITSGSTHATYDPGTLHAGPEREACGDHRCQRRHRPRHRTNHRRRWSGADPPGPQPGQGRSGRPHDPRAAPGGEPDRSRSRSRLPGVGQVLRHDASRRGRTGAPPDQQRRRHDTPRPADHHRRIRAAAGHEPPRSRRSHRAPAPPAQGRKGAGDLADQHRRTKRHHQLGRPELRAHLRRHGAPTGSPRSPSDSSDSSSTAAARPRAGESPATSPTPASLRPACSPRVRRWEDDATRSAYG